jgi:hypothetical protein
MNRKNHDVEKQRYWQRTIGDAARSGMIRIPAMPITAGTRSSDVTLWLETPESRFKKVGSQYMVPRAPVSARKYARVNLRIRASPKASKMVGFRILFFACSSSCNSLTSQSRSS